MLADRDAVATLAVRDLAAESPDSLVSLQPARFRRAVRDLGPSRLLASLAGKQITSTF